jgi:metal-dependent amidase/aminoacylase/carboxypeptidase family protein
VNDPEASRRIVEAFRRHFSANRVLDSELVSASEDFWSFGTEWKVPAAFWFVGGTDPDTYSKAPIGCNE